MPTRCNKCFFLLQILLLAQHVSGTIMTIIRSSRVLYRWLLPVVFGALVFKLSVWCGAEGYVSGLRAAAAAKKFSFQRPWMRWGLGEETHKNVKTFQLFVFGKIITQWSNIKYRGADKSLTRPTSRCILFDGENISFDASLVLYIYK